MDDFRKSLGPVTQTDGVWEQGSFAEWRKRISFGTHRGWIRLALAGSVWTNKI